MAKLENDLTRNPTPALIVAGPRSGGTFLAHCLSNHPDIYCERQEVLHESSAFFRVGKWMKPHHVLQIVWGHSGYEAACCRVQYAQLSAPGLWDLVQQHKAVLIHLTRKNKLRQAVSVIINQGVRRRGLAFHPQHTTTRPEKPMTLALRPLDVQRLVQRLIDVEEAWKRMIQASSLPNVDVTYERITGGSVEADQLAPDVTEWICKALGVPVPGQPLKT